MAPTRLLGLLSLLQGGRRWPASELAERLEISPRTLRRDLDRLRDAGYAVESLTGPDGGYRLVPGYDLPPLLFDDDQVLAIAVALRTMPDSIAGLADSADRALAGIRQVLPARLRVRLDLLEVSATRSGREPVKPDELIAIAQAIRRREVLRFDYPGRDGTVVRRVEPHHVVARGGRWYLIGWDADRADWRTFRVDRLRTRTPTGPRFEPRQLPADGPAEFLSERIGGGPLLCRGTAVLHLPAEQVLPWVGSDAVVESDGPDRCRVTASSWTWGGLAAWFGFFDVELDLVAPDELIEAGRRLADRLDRPRPGAG
ncbi:helix-turn-helix transcriptional regulator [Microlunatus parietis]|uniref:Biotin operon repressor n=1 Tax=Microlunatus parietis TaxID=682979 RepID=A0A7Y9IDK6_9ACTN|nr:WYL domain-containing protein [Microlunatus parietis]NYE74810.1 biotin operon repressor [Microlunatus parietis]